MSLKNGSVETMLQTSTVKALNNKNCQRPEYAETSSHSQVLPSNTPKIIISVSILRLLNRLDLPTNWHTKYTRLNTKQTKIRRERKNNKKHIDFTKFGMIQHNANVFREHFPLFDPCPVGLPDSVQLAQRSPVICSSGVSFTVGCTRYMFVILHCRILLFGVYHSVIHNTIQVYNVSSIKHIVQSSDDNMLQYFFCFP